MLVATKRILRYEGLCMRLLLSNLLNGLTKRGGGEGGGGGEGWE